MLLKIRSGAVSNNVFDKESSVAIKGIAILMMILHHNFREPYLYENIAVSFAPFSDVWITNIARMCKICASLFAFISGYGLFLSCRKKSISADKWALDRYISSFSGFWFVWVVFSVMTQLANGRFAKIFFRDGLCTGLIEIIIDFSGTAKLFGTPTLNGTWWYMSAAAVFILLIAIGYNQIRKNPLIVVLTFVVFTRVIFEGRESSAYTGENSVYTFIPIFLMGAVCANCGLLDKFLSFGNKTIPQKTIKFIFESLALLLFYKIYKAVPEDRFWEIKFCMIPMLVIVFYAEFIITIPHLRNVLIFLGRHSANIFMVHTFYRAYYLHDFIYSWKHFLLISAVLLLISIITSIIIEWMKRITRFNVFVTRLRSRVTSGIALKC